MSEETAVAATENIDAFFGQINEAISIFSAKVIEVAPEAAEAILSLVQFKGGFNIAVGVLFLIATVAVFKFGFLSGISDLREDEYSGIGLFKAMAGGFIAFVSGFITCVYLLSFYNWVSAFYPEGAIALKALEAVGVSL